MRVGDFEANVLGRDPGLGRLKPRVLDKPWRGVRPEGEAVRADQLGQPLRRLAEAAADVDAATARRRREAIKEVLGDLRQGPDEDLAVLLPAFVEDRVPGPHGLLVGRRHRSGLQSVAHPREATRARRYSPGSSRIAG